MDTSVLRERDKNTKKGGDKIKGWVKGQQPTPKENFALQNPNSRKEALIAHRI